MRGARAPGRGGWPSPLRPAASAGAPDRRVPSEDDDVDESDVRKAPIATVCSDSVWSCRGTGRQLTGCSTSLRAEYPMVALVTTVTRRNHSRALVECTSFRLQGHAEHVSNAAITRFDFHPDLVAWFDPSYA